MTTTAHVEQNARPLAADSLISDACRLQLRNLIDEFNGCEVFCIASCDAKGAVEEIDPIAFGNWDAVPAPARNARAGQVLIHNHPSGELDPSGADINIASAYGEAGVGFYIVDNLCEHVRVVVKPFTEKKLVPLDTDRLSSIFAPGGMLAAEMATYEFRPQQLEMLELVAKSFNENQLAVIEAGTGVGKSFAYLAPAIEWAVTNGERVAVSTNTINLQEQLIEKDVPALRKLLDRDFKAVLMKGRSNYVSLRRLKFAAHEADLFPDAKGAELKQLQAWAAKTQNGTVSELPFQVTSETWEAAMSDKDDCLRARCPSYNDCFFYKSRREAAAADLIIANHHLVMADVAVRGDSTRDDIAGILPPFKRLVFDEAHNLEEVATSYFSTETSQLGIRRQMSKLIAPRDGKGALARVQRALFQLDSSNLYKPTKLSLELLADEIPEKRSLLDGTLDAVFNELFHRTLSYFNVDHLGDRDKAELRVTGDVLESPFWKDIERLIEDLAKDFSAFLKPLEQLGKYLKQYPEELQRELANLRLSVHSAYRKLADHLAALRMFLKASNETSCRWFEASYFRGRPSLNLCIAPLDVAPNLRKALFERKHTVILTSATMTVEDSFDFVAGRLGLPTQERPAARAVAAEKERTAGDLPPLEERVNFLRLGSPFDFQNNCLIGIATDVETPENLKFESGAFDLIFQTLQVTHGRAFVLFTAYGMLRRAYDALNPRLREAGITALRQGEMPRNKLLDVFRDSEAAALFATSSFWEGVDVQGRALECVILARLPFRVPTTPILEARVEQIEKNGGDAFKEYSLPLAVIRFRQGFGRLIRSKEDRGIVLILDRRAVTKFYGKSFLRSLPPARVLQQPAAQLVQSFADFQSLARGSSL